MVRACPPPPSPVPRSVLLTPPSSCVRWTSPGPATRSFRRGRRQRELLRSSARHTALRRPDPYASTDSPVTARRICGAFFVPEEAEMPNRRTQTTRPDRRRIDKRSPRPDRRTATEDPPRPVSMWTPPALNERLCAQRALSALPRRPWGAYAEGRSTLARIVAQVERNELPQDEASEQLRQLTTHLLLHRRAEDAIRASGDRTPLGHHRFGW